MRTPPVRVYFDYVDPASWLLDQWLRSLEDDGHGVRRIPFEISRPGEPLLDPGGEAWLRRWRKARAVDDAGRLPGAAPDFVPWTRKAHELALQAREEDRFAEVHDGLFAAYHLDGRDIGRVDVLVELATAHGLDRTETKAALDVDRQLERLRELRNDAERRGVRGVPTLLAGDRILEGVHDHATVRSFLETSTP